MVRAFSHRNYRLFFAGQLVSLVGTFLTTVATVWLVYHITGSALLLGVVGFAGQIPMFCLAPFAGVWVDRWNKQKLLVATQSLSMIQSFGLAAVALWAWKLQTRTEVGAIVGLALFQGLINAFDIPGRQAFLVEMVDRREDLANAIALNSTMVHGARLIGPAIGGLMIHFIGPALCFGLDGISYVGVIAALIAMHVRPRVKPVEHRSVLYDLREGLRYVGQLAPIRWMLLLMALLSLTGMPALSVLMPIFAEHFGGAARSDMMLGILMGASGLGAMSGAIYLAARKTVLGLGRLIAVASAVFGAAVFGFGCSHQLWLSLVIVPIAGLGMLMSFASVNTLLQTLTDDHMRGRVMSLFTVAFIGMAPWGNLICGASARALGSNSNIPGDVIGASRTLMICGVIVFLAAIVFAINLPALRRQVRPIYIKKGIIAAPLEEGMESAAGMSVAMVD
jgi:MFS family permease